MDSNFWTPTSLALFIAFFIPGFISQKVYGLIVSDDQPESGMFIASAVAYSSLNFALMSPILWWLVATGQLSHPVVVGFVLFVIFLIVPALLPLGWLWIRRRPALLRRTLSPIKRPWDYVFNGQSEYWVIVTFKDGEKMAGIYGRRSFSSSYPRKEQIYLEKVWVLADDGTFVHEAPETKGAIILSDEITSIELFSSPEGTA